MEGKKHSSGKPNTEVRVIVGHDHRNGSEEFAKVTASTFKSRGFTVYSFGPIVPTPYVPFAVKGMGLDFGVMITASHNPKDDNGYKAYDSSGRQINSPVDKEIASLIPRQNRILWDINEFNDGGYIDPFDSIHEAYLRSTTELFSHLPPFETIPKIVHTSMHGVAARYVTDLVKQASLPALIPVPEQEKPDPEFPTVAFPNPEEGAGALQLAFNQAQREEAKIVFANDPDVDRFNFAEIQDDGNWKIFNGNEIALLLADFLYRYRRSKEKPVAMIASLVSSKLLSWMAEFEGFKFEQAQTGFKNLSAAAIDLSNKGYDVLLTYEEAIGYMVGTNVLDKDGLSALLTAYYMVSEIYSNGSTLRRHLLCLFEKYGFQVQFNSYYMTSGNQKQVFAHAVEKFKKIESSKTFGKYTIKSAANFQPESSMIFLEFEDLGGTWMAIRTSGTEPKIKFYSECRALERSKLMDISSKLQELVLFVCNDLLSPNHFDLKLKN